MVGKTYDEVHDIIAESRHDRQVELRVSRSLTSSASALIGGLGLSGDPGRPAAMLGPQDPRKLLRHHHHPAASSPFSQQQQQLQFQHQQLQCPPGGTGSGGAYHDSTLASSSILPPPHSGLAASVRASAVGDSAAASIPGALAARPAVMVSDPLGGTHVLNPLSPGTTAAASSLATRIQVRLPSSPVKDVY